MKKIVFLLMSACAWSQTGLDRPQIGQMLDQQGAVRTVYGIAASVMRGDAGLSGVLSYGCSTAVCLWKTASSVVSATGLADAPGGPAMFAFDGAGAFVWFPQSRQLARWQNDTLAFLDVAIEGEVLSIGASNGAPQFAVRRRNGVWIVNQDGSIAGGLPRSVDQAILTPWGAVYAARGEIIAGNTSFPLSGVTAFFAMSGSYLQVRTGGADYALRIDPGRETLFQLPGGGQ